MNKDKSLLSVIVPVFNEEKYIEECVNSILKQTYMEIEIILVNDGSTDQSGMICDRLAQKNDRIKVVHTENGGITKARLEGLKVSLGKWVTFVDADDWIDEYAYEDLLLDDCYDVIITGICRYVDSKNQRMQMPYLNAGKYNKESIIKEIAPIMLWNNKLEDWALDPSLCTKIFKREILLEQLEKASNIGSDYGEDSMVVFPLMLQVDCICIFNKIYYFHRQRSSGEIAPYIRDDSFIVKLGMVYEYLKKEFKSTPYWNIMKDQLDCFYINSICLKKRCYAYSTLKFVAHFPIEQIHPNSNVVLYGAGKLGHLYWEQNILYHFCNIRLWVDINFENLQKNNKLIQDPETIRSEDFDYVLIALDNYCSAIKAAFYLKDMGVEEEKIVWHSARIYDKKLI